VEEIGSHDREAMPRWIGYWVCFVNSHAHSQSSTYHTYIRRLDVVLKRTTWPNPVSLAVEEKFGLFQYLAKDLGFGLSEGELRGCCMNLAGSDLLINQILAPLTML